MPRKTVIRVESGKPVSPIGSRRVQKEDQWGGYVQCEVGVTERASFDEFCAGGNAVPSQLAIDALATGLKLTFVWDGGNDCFIATFTGRPDPDGVVAFTCSLSARAGDMQTTLNLLVYKHFEVMGGDWTEWLVNGARTKRSFG